MKLALFIGATDITDLLHYTSKVITTTGKRVLLVDGTDEQYIRYGTPLPNETLKVVEFEGFDVAIGFKEINELEVFLAEEPAYDHVIVQISEPKFLGNYDLSRFENRFISTTSEKRSIEKTLTVLHALLDGTENESKFEFMRIAMNRVETDIADDYLETLLSSYPIEWVDEVIEIFFDEDDYRNKINYQHSGKINIRRLSRSYKNAIQDICEKLTGLGPREIKRTFKISKRRT